MKIVIQLLIFFISSYIALPQGTSYVAPKTGKPKPNRITVDVYINKDSFSKKDDSLQVSFSSIHAVGLSREWTAQKQKLSQGVAHWAYEANGLVYISMPFLLMPYAYWIAEPGDSVFVSVNNNEVKFSGKAADQFTLQHQVRLLKEKMKTPTKEPIILNPITLSQYFDWISVLNEYERQFMLLIDSYKSRVSKPVLDYIRDQAANVVVDRLKDLFYRLSRLAKKDGFKTITNDDICSIYDSTIGSKIVKWFPYLTDGYLGSWRILKTHVARRFKFQFEKEPLNSEFKRALLYYEEGIKLYANSPLSREQFLTRLLTEDLLDDKGYTPEIRALLERYYAEPGYPEYKTYVKNHEIKRKSIRAGAKAPNFMLTDTEGNPFFSQNLKGKIVLMDFWFTGCIGCVGMAPRLKKIENEFKGDTNIVFLSISTDKEKDKWLRSIKEKKYSTGEWVNLYTNGNGTGDYLVDALMVTSYPALYLLDNENRFVQNPLPDPRKDNGDSLIRLIYSKRAFLNDGPYVLHEQNQVNAYSINAASVSVNKSSREDFSEFLVRIDRDRSFNVKLKKELEPAVAIYKRPKKLLVLSDIEGNFAALSKLLQANGVIDEKFNWTFGDGHLVFAGDMFDRGEQVTECLWLLYSLEEKAAKANGQVHFILGNHEIMNLSGNHDYVKQKYHRTAKLLGKTLAGLYNEESELGRWLRSKNIVEKIGDMLFLHAGISPELNRLSLSVEEINELARPYYDKDSIASKSGNTALSLIYSTKFSPFWYRLYYLDSEQKIKVGKNGYDSLYKTSSTDIDRILKNFAVNRIITGHTIVDPGDKVTMHYNGRVINTDTRHASGNSEALLIDGDHYFRVNDKGERIVLFNEE